MHATRRNPRSMPIRSRQRQKKWPSRRPGAQDSMRPPRMVGCPALPDPGGRGSSDNDWAIWAYRPSLATRRGPRSPARHPPAASHGGHGTPKLSRGKPSLTALPTPEVRYGPRRRSRRVEMGAPASCVGGDRGGARAPGGSLGGIGEENGGMREGVDENSTLAA